MAAACDGLLQVCLERGTVDNISVVLIVLGAPPSAQSVMHCASARGTPAPGTAAGLHDVLASAGLLTTPSRVATGTRNPAGSHHAHSHAHNNGSHMHQSHSSAARLGALRSSDDDDGEDAEEGDVDAGVDLPIFNIHQPNTGSLHEIFAAVADSANDSNYAASPLNTMAGSSKVRKQLQFNST